jgi:hypothetical protein
VSEETVTVILIAQAAEAHERRLADGAKEERCP